MVDGYDYTFLNKGFPRALIESYKKYGNNYVNIPKEDPNHKILTKAFKESEEFNEGKQLLQNIIPLFPFYGISLIDIYQTIKTYNISKKQSNLENHFIKKGEPYTVGFISNFVKIPTINDASGFLSMKSNPNGAIKFTRLRQYTNKLNYSKQYNEAIKALEQLAE